MSDNQQLEINNDEVYPEISVKECLLEGWECFKLNPWALVGGLVLYYIVIISIMLLTRNDSPSNSFYLNQALNIILMPPFYGGLILITLKAARNDNPKIGLLVRGLSKYLNLFACNILIYTMMVLLMLPTIIMYFTMLNDMNNTSAGYFAFTLLINMIFAVAIMIRFYFVFHVMMDYDNISVINALKKSSFLIKGYFWTLILYGLLSTVIIVIGFFLFLIPGILAMFATFVGYTKLYIKIKRIKGETEPPIPDFQ